MLVLREYSSKFKNGDHDIMTRHNPFSLTQFRNDTRTSIIANRFRPGRTGQKENMHQVVSQILGHKLSVSNSRGGNQMDKLFQYRKQ